MKKHNTIKVILGMTLICVILTWIINAASFSSEFVDQGKLQMGLFDLFNYPLTALTYFGYISIYIICVGGFYGILNKIPAYSKLLDNISNGLKKHGKLSISLIIVLLAVITSVCGLQLGLFLFFPLIASIVLLMGYDKIVVALTLVGSTMVGVIGTTYGYGNIGMLVQNLGLKMTDNIPFKVAVLILGLFLLILNTLLYINKKNPVSTKEEKVEEIEAEKVEEVKVAKVSKDEKAKEASTKKTTTKAKTTTKKATGKTTTAKKNTTTKTTSKSKSKNNNKAAALDEEVIVSKKTEKKVKTWPLIVGFIILLVVMILAFIPWSTVFGIDLFSEAVNSIGKFKIFGFELFAKLLGTYNAFGEWTITDMLFPMGFVVILLAIIYNIKFSDIIDGFAEGAKKALAPAATTLLIYVILVINVYHPFQLTIYKAILGTSSNLNVVTSSLTALLSGVLNVEPIYAFQSVIPYLTSVVTNSEVYPIISIIFPAMYGLSMIFAPTSVVLMSVLSYIEVSYKDWLKATWKLILELLVVLLILFTILILM